VALHKGNPHKRCRVFGQTIAAVSSHLVRWLTVLIGTQHVSLPKPNNFLYLPLITLLILSPQIEASINIKYKPKIAFFGFLVRLSDIVILILVLDSFST